MGLEIYYTCLGGSWNGKVWEPLDLITISSEIYGNTFFLSWSEQTWQTCYLLVQMTIYGDNSYLGHIFQDVG